MFELSSACWRLFCNPIPPMEAGRLLRGVFANRNTNRPEFHQHGKDGLLYTHPKIQYKCIQPHALIVGLQEGADLLELLTIPKLIRLGKVETVVVNQHFSKQTTPFGVADEEFYYSFLTPWIPLNQENYRKYRNMRDGREKQAFLKRIFIGNLLSASKSVNYHENKQIEVSLDVYCIGSLKLKGVDVLGFLGGVKTNFSLPEQWGLGKSSSFGFGTLKRL